MENSSLVGSINSKRKSLIMVIIIAIIFIVVGFILLYFYNDKRVMGKAIDNVNTTFINKYLMNRSNIQEFDNYTIESDIKFDIKSDYLQQLTQYFPSYSPYVNLMNNISKTNNKLIFKQDKTNQKAFINLDSNYNNESLISVKYLIENNTEYYYIKGFLDNYINNGTSNYFESLQKNSNNKENIKYVYEFAIDSFKRNLKSEYFTKTSEKVQIKGKEKNLKKVTLEIDNKRLTEIATLILNDLKSDEKANKILTGIDNDFKKAKISSSKFLNSKQKVILSVYVDNLTYIIKKYQLDFIYDMDIISVTYEKNKQGILNVYKNKILEGNLIIDYNKDETIIHINDGNKKSLGQVKIKTSDNLYKIDINISVDSVKFNLLLQQDITNIKKDKSYDSKVLLQANINNNNSSLANIKISGNSKISKGVKIEENTDNAVFSKDLDSIQPMQLNTYIYNIFSKLMS